jgi:N-carbamoyl-L-amino-acid hydrolase
MAGWRINGERLWDSLMALAEIGATPKGGCCRLTLTDLDRQGRDLVIGWAQAAGMSVTVDKIGNVFMRREGRNPLPPIVSGSHIDTQPTGGKFDGNYGVLAALEVVRTLNDLDIETEAPIEVVFWTNEEGSRFVPVMMGSGVFAGVFPLETIYAAQDAQGKTVGEELARIGYIGSQTPGDHPIGAYFEAHIEQGPILEDEENHRRGAGRAGDPLVRLRGDGAGVCRANADAPASGCLAGGDPDHAGGGGDCRA